MKKHSFKTFGEQLKAIAEAGRPGGKIDSRLLPKQHHKMKKVELPKAYVNHMLKAIMKSGLLAGKELDEVIRKAAKEYFKLRKE